MIAGGDATLVTRAEAGDLDGDSGVDLLAVSTLLNDGTGAFTLVGSYRAAFGYQGVAVAGLNQDGALDVAMAEILAASLLLGGGDGTSGPRDSFNCRLQRGLYVSAVAAADVNADCHANMLVTRLHEMLYGDGSYRGELAYSNWADPAIYK